jgi:hypothetical protein
MGPVQVRAFGQLFLGQSLLQAQLPNPPSQTPLHVVHAPASWPERLVTTNIEGVLYSQSPDISGHHADVEAAEAGAR